MAAPDSTPDAVYPALLHRARTSTVERDKLQSQLNQEYDVGIAKRIGELAAVSDALKRWEHANEVP